MERDRWLSVTVGAFVLAALAALMLTILSLSSQQGIWSERYRLVAYFENVQGLIANAPVWLAGTPVGRVESVTFAARPSGEPAVRVVLQVDRDVQSRVRRDSQASIGTIGLLGDRYVELSLGTDAAPPLDEGGEIGTLTPTDLSLVIDRGAVALDEVSSLASNLNAVVSDFSQGVGGRRLADVASGMAEIVERVQTGEGLLHSLIFDDYEGGGVESIERSLAMLERILWQIEQGEGVLHRLVYDAPEDPDVLLKSLQAAARLEGILDKLDRGEGTLGLLLNDPTLYEELLQLVGGARRSRVVRALVTLAEEDE